MLSMWKGRGNGRQMCNHSNRIYGPEMRLLLLSLILAYEEAWWNMLNMQVKQIHFDLFFLYYLKSASMAPVITRW